MLNWILLHSQTDLGFLPGLISENDPRCVKDQLNDTYRHGGGWFPMHGHRLDDNNVLHYPGDPPLKPLAMAQLRDELILFYPYSFLCIVQPDRSFEVARVD